MDAWAFTKWFNRGWYQYLRMRTPYSKDVPRWAHLWCRIRNHPHGVVYYNPSGLEPDMRCKDCGEDLG